MTARHMWVLNLSQLMTTLLMPRWFLSVLVQTDQFRVAKITKNYWGWGGRRLIKDGVIRCALLLDNLDMVHFTRILVLTANHRADNRLYSRLCLMNFFSFLAKSEISRWYLKIGCRLKLHFWKYIFVKLKASVEDCLIFQITIDSIIEIVNLESGGQWKYYGTGFFLSPGKYPF